MSRGRAVELRKRIPGLQERWELGLEDFAGRASRERVEDGEAAGIFECGEAVAAVRDQVIGSG